MSEFTADLIDAAELTGARRLKVTGSIRIQHGPELKAAIMHAMAGGSGVVLDLHGVVTEVGAVVDAADDHVRRHGHEVVQAVDGQDALQKLNNRKVDMLITDLNMPNLDGIGLIKEARALPSCKFIPIVMLTTESQESKRQEGKAAGATGWIVKPFKPEQLLAVVRKVLG